MQGRPQAQGGAPAVMEPPPIPAPLAGLAMGPATRWTELSELGPRHPEAQERGPSRQSPRLEGQKSSPQAIPAWRSAWA